MFWNLDAGAVTATLMTKTQSNPSLCLATIDHNPQGTVGTCSNDLTSFGLRAPPNLPRSVRPPEGDEKTWERPGVFS